METSGHRQRLRERFLAGTPESRTELAFLELLLCYALPQRDTKPLAQALLDHFCTINGVLGAAPDALKAVRGLQEATATYLKVLDHLVRRDPATVADLAPSGFSEQRPLFELDYNAPPVSLHPQDSTPIDSTRYLPTSMRAASNAKNRARPRARTELFTNSLLAEAIETLPSFPDSDSIDTAIAYLRESLRFNAESTRQRYAEYITSRMFPNDVVDRPLREFARAYRGQSELSDACFLRFCVAEPLVVDVVENILVPMIGTGLLGREQLRHYVQDRFPNSPSAAKCVSALMLTLVDGGVVRRESNDLKFAYRDVLPASFAFALHSEFPPGMYDIGEFEANRRIRALLWNPDQLVPSLYALRNQGILPKVSDIDGMRQFTVNLTLDQVVSFLTAEAKVK